MPKKLSVSSNGFLIGKVDFTFTSSGFHSRILNFMLPIFVDIKLVKNIFMACYLISNLTIESVIYFTGL